MKKNLVILAALALLSNSVLVFAGGGTESSAGGAKEPVKLVMGSWRADDVEQMKGLLAEYSKTHPNVIIEFKPTNPPDYNATLRLQLTSGTGPDLMYARSYATGLQLFNDGFFADVSSIPGLKENFTEGARSPWMTADGKSFAVPFVAVSHGVYYNKDIFNKLRISIPETWEDFLKVCDKIKAAGITPVANSLGDEWDIAEVVFMSIAPNFIGGREGRLAYESGKRPWNDANMVATFQAMKDLVPYLPAGFEALTYNDSNALFATGKAAMYFDGSWTLGTFKDVPFQWGVFAPPPPKGKAPQICFHADAGIAMNTKTKYPKEASEFLAWIASKDGATIAAKYLPTGFYPMINAKITIADPHANEMLALNQGRGLDVRLAWPRLMEGEPSGYNLIMYGSIQVMKGIKTPQQAADDLAAGLAKWFKPTK
ncbi:ABC transporter substrate-binding protein [Gracilinema caldarium]|uniref:ABC transporter substrate-binding protein n=1 Tax=Gracilinema caldarium TaxID=215591 RepID=UPI0026EF8A8C|nr:extracellular solute-binding protein [Gracilinema caldarium]